MASIAGSTMIGYAGLGVPIDYLLAASLMAIPGGILFARMLSPATEETQVTFDNLSFTETPPKSIIEAAASGAMTGLKIAAGVATVVMAFVAYLHFSPYLQTGGTLDVKTIASLTEIARQLTQARYFISLRSGFFVLLCFQPGYLFRPNIRISRFQNQRDPIKSVVAHDPAKRRVADIAFAQAVMAVDPASKSAFSVVKMHAA